MQILVNALNMAREWPRIWPRPWLGFRKAAEQGDVFAQFNLGLQFEKGMGVAKSTKDALVWYRKAADQGYEKARNRVALLSK